MASFLRSVFGGGGSGSGDSSDANSVTDQQRLQVQRPPGPSQPPQPPPPPPAADPAAEKPHFSVARAASAAAESSKDESMFAGMTMGSSFDGRLTSSKTSAAKFPKEEGNSGFTFSTPETAAPPLPAVTPPQSSAPTFSFQFAKTVPDTHDSTPAVVRVNHAFTPKERQADATPGSKAGAGENTDPSESVAAPSSPLSAPLPASTPQKVSSAFSSVPGEPKSLEATKKAIRDEQPPPRPSVPLSGAKLEALGKRVKTVSQRQKGHYVALGEALAKTKSLKELIETTEKEQNTAAEKDDFDCAAKLDDDLNTFRSQLRQTARLAADARTRIQDDAEELLALTTAMCDTAATEKDAAQAEVTHHKTSRLVVISENEAALTAERAAIEEKRELLGEEEALVAERERECVEFEAEIEEKLLTGEAAEALKQRRLLKTRENEITAEIAKLEKRLLSLRAEKTVCSSKIQDCCRVIEEAKGDHPQEFAQLSDLQNKASLARSIWERKTALLSGEAEVLEQRADLLAKQAEEARTTADLLRDKLRDAAAVLRTVQHQAACRKRWASEGASARRALGEAAASLERRTAEAARLLDVLTEKEGDVAKMKAQLAACEAKLPKLEEDKRAAVQARAFKEAKELSLDIKNAMEQIEVCRGSMEVVRSEVVHQRDLLAAARTEEDEARAHLEQTELSAAKEEFRLCQAMLRDSLSWHSQTGDDPNVTAADRVSLEASIAECALYVHGCVLRMTDNEVLEVIQRIKAAGEESTDRQKGLSSACSEATPPAEAVQAVESEIPLPKPNQNEQIASCPEDPKGRSLGCADGSSRGMPEEVRGLCTREELEKEIQDLEERLAAAVEIEDYDLADSLQTAIEALQAQVVVAVSAAVTAEVNRDSEIVAEKLADGSTEVQPPPPPPLPEPLEPTFRDPKTAEERPCNEDISTGIMNTHLAETPNTRPTSKMTSGTLVAEAPHTEPNDVLKDLNEAEVPPPDHPAAPAIEGRAAVMEGTAAVMEDTATVMQDTAAVMEGTAIVTAASPAKQHGEVVSPPEVDNSGWDEEDLDLDGVVGDSAVTEGVDCQGESKGVVATDADIVLPETSPSSSFPPPPPIPPRTTADTTEGIVTQVTTTAEDCPAKVGPPKYDAEDSPATESRRVRTSQSSVSAEAPLVSPANGNDPPPTLSSQELGSEPPPSTPPSSHEQEVAAITEENTTPCRESRECGETVMPQTSKVGGSFDVSVSGPREGEKPAAAGEGEESSLFSGMTMY